MALPPDPAEVGLDAHLAATAVFSDRLAAARCRPSGRFDDQAQDAVATLTPLLSQWVPDILIVLRIHGPLRFNQIKSRMRPLSSRVLTDKLRDLMDRGWVDRVADKTQHHYGLTPKGQNVAILLHPLLYYLNQATNQQPDHGHERPSLA